MKDSALDSARSAAGASDDTLRAYRSCKRAIDIVASGLLLVVTAPVAAAAAIWIKWDSPGPVIFRQTRIGLHGKLFIMLKFRTMVVGAPTLPTDQMIQQPRTFTTRSGTFLRRFSLDELPQLWNVLAGDMSLVGARPALPSQEALNAARARNGVHDLCPGMTGWAQVSGRDSLTDEVKLDHDVYYRQHCSFSLDLKIVTKTIQAIITGHGTR